MHTNLLGMTYDNIHLGVNFIILISSGLTVQTYHYYIDTRQYHDPLTFRYRMHQKKPINLEAMRAAAAAMTGRHDFTQFSNISLDAAKRNPVKTINRLDVVEIDGGLRLEVGLNRESHVMDVPYHSSSQCIVPVMKLLGMCVCRVVVASGVSVLSKYAYWHTAVICNGIGAL